MVKTLFSLDLFEDEEVKISCFLFSISHQIVKVYNLVLTRRWIDLPLQKRLYDAKNAILTISYKGFIIRIY